MLLVFFFFSFLPMQVSMGNSTIGKEVLTSHGLDFDGYFYWISIGALFCFTMFFDLGFVLALTYLKRKPILADVKHFLQAKTETIHSCTNLQILCKCSSKSIPSHDIEEKTVSTTIKQSSQWWRKEKQ